MAGLLFDQPHGRGLALLYDLDFDTLALGVRETGQRLVAGAVFEPSSLFHCLRGFAGQLNLGAAIAKARN